MQWTEQTETMINAFAETQQQMWKKWFDWVPGVASPTPEGLKTWAVEGEQVTKVVAERLLASQGKLLG